MIHRKLVDCWSWLLFFAMNFDYTDANTRYRRLRRQCLESGGGTCQNCARYGRGTPATVAHHAWPVEDFPEYGYCRWNLIRLCKPCHDAMHDRISRKLTPLGLYWRRRTPPHPDASEMP